MENAPIAPGEKYCRTCRFYEFFDDREQDESGECRRHAPQPQLTKDPNTDELLYANWPFVRFNACCGEWQYDTEIDSSGAKPEIDRQSSGDSFSEPPHQIYWFPASRHLEQFHGKSVQFSFAVAEIYLSGVGRFRVRQQENGEQSIDIVTAVEQFPKTRATHVFSMLAEQVDMICPHPDTMIADYQCIETDEEGTD